MKKLQQMDTEASLKFGLLLLKSQPKCAETFGELKIPVSSGKTITKSEIILVIFKTLNTIGLFCSAISGWTEIIENLSKVLTSLIKTHETNDEKGCLVTECNEFDSVVFETYFDVDSTQFYSENAAFFLCFSMRIVTKIIISVLPSFFAFFNSGRNIIFRLFCLLFRCVMYFFNPKLRSERYVRSVIEANLVFMKVNFD